VATPMRRMPELIALDRAKSMMRLIRRNRPPAWRGCRSVPKAAAAPPAST
jgi:hypothetical protein